MVPMADKLIQANLVFSTAFQEGVNSLKESIDITYTDKARVVSLPGTEEAVFGFLAEMPLFRKWIGEREPKRLRTGSYSIKVDDYEFSYEVGRNDIKFDKIGLLADAFRGGGVASKRFYEDNVNSIQDNAKTLICFDGQYFYDTDHPEGLDGSGSTFQNLWTSMAFTAANVATRYAYMAKLKDANGKRMGIRPNVIEFGPDHILDIREILEAEIVGQAVSSTGVFGGTTSVVGAASKSNMGVRGLLTPLLNNDLPAGVWYLHDTRVMKPFIILEETPPTGLITRDDPRDPHVWNNKAFLYGADATAGFGVGLPHLSVRCEE
jgi:phage major head subunit gpT-like protein